MLPFKVDPRCRLIRITAETVDHLLIDILSGDPGEVNRFFTFEHGDKAAAVRRKGTQNTQPLLFEFRARLLQMDAAAEKPLVMPKIAHIHDLITAAFTQTRLEVSRITSYNVCYTKLLRAIFSAYSVLIASSLG